MFLDRDKPVNPPLFGVIWDAPAPRIDSLDGHADIEQQRLMGTSKIARAGVKPPLTMLWTV
jgi:hypothetical protein